MTKFNPVQNWLDNVYVCGSRSKDTMKRYERSFNLFCDFIGKTGSEIVEEYETSEYRKFQRKYSQLIKAWLAHLSRQDYADNTISGRIVAIKSFFKYSDLPLGFVPQPKPIVTFHNRDITKEEIKHILDVSVPRDRAFFYVMLSSGLRPYTLKKLKLKHLQPDLRENKNPICIRIPQELAKGKYQQHWTFITNEAAEALKQYLQTRPEATDDSFLFTKLGTEDPIRSKTLSSSFKRLAEQLREKGVLEFETREDKPGELRLYCLRKYFSIQAGVVPHYKEFWMGHIDAVREAYLSKDVEHHRKIYQEKVADRLRIKEITLNETVVTEQQKRIEQQQTEIEKLKAQNIELSRKIERIEKIDSELDEKVKLLGEMNKTLDRLEAQLEIEASDTFIQHFEKHLRKKHPEMVTAYQKVMDMADDYNVKYEEEMREKIIEKKKRKKFKHD